MARERRSRPKQPQWPSVDEQLRDAGVVHGSALEQLVRDNQDFELLHPDEANDGLPLPPWLRVHWRKLNPDEVPEADSPAAAYPYPDVLDSVYEWMRIHQDLPRWYGEEKPSRGGRQRRPRGGGRSRGGEGRR
jgi:hypothetical protein